MIDEALEELHNTTQGVNKYFGLKTSQEEKDKNLELDEDVEEVKDLEVVKPSTATKGDKTTVS